MNNFKLKEVNGIWALDKKTLDSLLATVKAEESDGENETKEPQPLTAEIYGSIGIVMVTGLLTKYSYCDGCTSTLQLKNVINGLIYNPDVTAILLYIDSPGGEIAGISDVADTIYDSPKPVVAVVSDMCASAAYWIASQCDAIYANNSAFVGSIGVYQVIADTSKMYEDMGIKINLIKAGDSKGIGVDGVPITPENIATEQTMINDVYTLFVNSVKRGRTLTVPVEQIGTGEVWIAQKALDLGLIDVIGDLNDAVQNIGNVIMSKQNDIANQIKAVAPVATIEAVTPAAVAPVAALAVEAVTASLVPAEAPMASVDAPEAPAIDVEAIVRAAKADAYAEAVANEQKRFAAVLKAVGGRQDLAVAEFVAGHDVGSATIAYARILEKENQELKAAHAGVSGGANFVASFVGSQVASGDTEADWEAEWENNADSIKERFGGLKANFIATRKLESKTKKKIV